LFRSSQANVKRKHPQLFNYNFIKEREKPKQVSLFLVFILVLLLFVAKCNATVIPAL